MLLRLPSLPCFRRLLGPQQPSACRQFVARRWKTSSSSSSSEGSTGGASAEAGAKPKHKPRPDDPVAAGQAGPASSRPLPSMWTGFAFAAVAGAGLWWFYDREKERKMQTHAKTYSKVVGTPLLGGAFDLVDVNGRRVRSQDLYGKYVLLYFGFTHCPDICPNELIKMGKALDIVDSRKQVGERVLPVFITVDPRRDTPEVMKEYSKSYHPRMLYLTGTDEQIMKAAKAYRVYYNKPDPEEKDYQVDHSIFFYLLDRHGQFLEFFGKNLNAQEVADKMTEVIIADKKQPDA